jgi:hypothetical protein
MHSVSHRTFSFVPQELDDTTNAQILVRIRILNRSGGRSRTRRRCLLLVELPLDPFVTTNWFRRQVQHTVERVFLSWWGEPCLRPRSKIRSLWVRQVTSNDGCRRIRVRLQLLEDRRGELLSRSSWYLSSIPVGSRSRNVRR